MWLPYPIGQRLQVLTRQAETPLVDYYRKKGWFVCFDGDLRPDLVAYDYSTGICIIESNIEVITS